MKRVFLFLLLGSLIVSSCRFMNNKSVRGDGNVTTQARTASGFTGIDVSGGITVHVTQDSSYSVKVEVDNNLQEYIEVFTEGDVLRIRQQNNTSLDATGTIQVYVSAPMLDRFGASGACKILGKTRFTSNNTIVIDMSGACEATLDLKTPRVQVGLSGACDVVLKGETKDISIEGSGSVGIRAFELLAENADIDVSGASDVEVYASVKLDVSGSGASGIRYKGNAAVNTDVSGASSVKKVD